MQMDSDASPAGAGRMACYHISPRRVTLSGPVTAPPPPLFPDQSANDETPMHLFFMYPHRHGSFSCAKGRC